MGAFLGACLALLVAAEPPSAPGSTLAFDLTVPPRLIHEELVLYGGIRPAEVQRGLEQLAARQSYVTWSRGDLVVAPRLMNDILGLHRNEYLQLRLTRATARLELRLTWN